MPRMIILDALQAARVRGPSASDPLAALDPVPVPDGLWMLPLAVLDDPAHAAWHELLASLPQEEIQPLPVELDEPETEIGFGKPKSVSRRGWVGRL